MEWTDSDSAKAVIEWAENGYLNAMSKLVKEEAEKAGKQTMREFWDKHNPDDGFGSFSTNPYQENKHDSERIDDLREITVEWSKVLKFVRERICGMV